MSADGKLAPTTRQFVPFTSKRDHELMLELRAENDAVMSGARTVDLCEVTMGNGGEKYRKKRRARGLKDEHLRVIVSGAGTIDPGAHIFKKRSSPIVILTTERAGRRLKQIRNLADAVYVSPGKNLNFRDALAWLRKEFGVKKLLCEGGGEVNGGLLKAGVIDQVYLTIAPLILGGQDAPTLADGEGFSKLADALQLSLTRMRVVGDELYTVWRVRK